MISALRDVSPNSLRPRIANAITSAEKLRDMSRLIGNNVNMMKVAITKGPPLGPGLAGLGGSAWGWAGLAGLATEIAIRCFTQ
ncbi:MAG TPA: hypothetical protein VL136_06155 [Candidatus Babeliales bacterium]|jgi:hypothetical protein|nr:hypothetical protein [Candidatus Babeliales bacterium]